ncbi:septin protein (macronuclear) [Tetrahymena thermophila SB210]|uniref:Septin protein n=1 Tax=Tetrahymena thermophila (strain SB210) TaxID=312017 RepID=W7X5Q4_TETTS|nr:septin protein [Tetrahymena thermophila SB210]EWS72727.1 septin protein [Tetrahymena thermophila SB210]|eukprot:XP_012654734.1 septin protein [Tetrahymena thermophila SB210]
MDSFYTTQNLLNSELLQTEYISNKGQYDTSKAESGNSQNSLDSQQNQSDMPSQIIQQDQLSSQFIVSQDINISTENNSIHQSNNFNSHNEEIIQHIQASQNSNVVQNQQISSEIRNLQQQIHEEHNNVNLNIMVVGESGTGKTTFINTFLHYDKRFKFQKKEELLFSKVVEHTYIKQDQDIRYQLQMIDTLGYGEKLSQEKWYKLVKQQIINKFGLHEQMEQSLFNSEVHQNKLLYLQKEKKFQDKRIHCCLYFLQPPRIKDSDLIYIQKLSKLVNVIPIIAKGDTLTQNETIELKRQFLEMCEDNGFQIYNIEKGLDRNVEFLNHIQNSPNGKCPPFTIVSSDFQLEDTTNHIYYGRQYNWGTVDILNPKHCDFQLLYNLLLYQINQDLYKSVEDYYQGYITKLAKKQEQEQNKVKHAQWLHCGIFIVAIAGGFIYSKFKRS